jgi:hypothetical protein
MLIGNKGEEILSLHSLQKLKKSAGSSISSVVCSKRVLHETNQRLYEK